MEIIFYRNNSPKEALNKSISEVFRLSGTIKEESSVIDPVITIESVANIASSCNYAYIPEFGRYYFITDIVTTSNTLWMISMHVDVLMSFRDDIKSSLIYTRNANNYEDSNISTDVLVQSEYTTCTVENYADGFSENGQYILITAGG